MKKITFLLSFIWAVLSFTANGQTVYADYEGTDMEFASWGAAAWAKVANPTGSSDATNPSANVGEFSHAGNNWWTGIGGTMALPNPVDFSATPYFRMKVWSANPIYVLLKIENFDDYNINSEVGYQLSAQETNKWVELTFNFSAETKTNLNKIVLYFDPEQKFSQAGTKYYFDDITASNAAPAGKFSFVPQDGAVDVKVQNSLKLSSNFALRLMDDSPISDPASVLSLKKTDANGADVPFTAYLSDDQKEFTLVPDLFLDASTPYWYGIKDGMIEYATGEAVTGVSASFTTTANAFPQVYTIEDFDGTSKVRVLETLGDPAPSFSVVSEADAGIGTGANQILKFNKSNSWGGWERIHMELMYPVEVVDGKAAFSMRVFFPKTTYVRLKLSNQKGDGGTYKETDADVTVVNGWQTLYFEFADLAPADYSHLLIYPAGGDGEALPYYIDDVKGPNIPTQDLKVDYFPANGATNGFSFTKMRITTNYVIRNLDNSPVTDLSGKVILRKGGVSGSDVAVNASISTDNKTITIVPDVPLEVGATYYYGIAENALKFEDNGANLTAINASFTVRAADMVLYNDFDGNSLCLPDPDGVYSIGSSVDNLWVGMDPDFINEYDNALEWARGTENWGWEHVQLKLNKSINTSGDKIFSLKVYSPKTTYVRMKLANDDGSVFKEVDADITKINEWETLYFDYTNVNLSDASYNTISYFIDGGNGDDPRTYYMDDVNGPQLVTSTGISNTPEDGLRLSPNPASDVIRISGVQSGQKTEIYNTAGTLVKTVINTTGLVHIADLKKGIYFIVIDGQVGKFIKK